MGYFRTDIRTNVNPYRLSSRILQVIYRVGDSITNPITPMMPYLPLLLTYAQNTINA